MIFSLQLLCVLNSSNFLWPLTTFWICFLLIFFNFQIIFQKIFLSGFLTTALRPYLTGLVPDISIVPVNVSYDRCLEESLFAYELLGVPKPKESTMVKTGVLFGLGFFCTVCLSQRFIKALKILKEDYGKVFIQFGEPLSVSEALRGRIDRSVHSYGPVILQDLTPTESQHVVGLAHDIINRQRNLTVH